MFRISLQTLRAHRATLAGAFVAIWLAVTLAYATGLLMAGALSAPGPGRFATADLVVRADPSVKTGDGTDDARPGPRLDASFVERVAAVPGVARAVGDITFPVGAWDAHGTPVLGSGLHGHSWSGAKLLAGRPPHGAHEVAVSSPVALGTRLRIATPTGEATYRVTGLTHGPAALYFADPTAGHLAGTPGEVNAIAVIATRGTTPAALRARLGTALAGDAPAASSGSAGERAGDGPAAAARSGAARARAAGDRADDGPAAAAPSGAARAGAAGDRADDAAAAAAPAGAARARAAGDRADDAPAAAAPAVSARVAASSGIARAAAAPRIEVLDRAHASQADSGDARAADRVALVAIFGTMGGIAGLVALFVVAGTFTLAIVQRRRELAVMRALGAAPHQVRRLIAGEALIVSLVAGILGLLAGRPLARAIVEVLADHGVVPEGFAAGESWIPLVAGLGGGIVIAQLAVFAAARRAGRTRPAEALRDAAIERPRPGVLQILAGLLCLGGGVAMALIFSGTWAVAFAILEGMLLAVGVGLLGRALLGFPAAWLARPLRAFGASGLLASTSLAANRWRTAALATPIVLVAMLAGTQGIVQSSGQRDTEAVTAARVTAPYVVVGRDGAPIPATTAERIHAAGVTTVAATDIYPDDDRWAEDAPWPAAAVTTRGAPALDLKVLAGDPSKGVAVSRVFAETGHLHLGDTFGARMADTSHRNLTVAAIYERAAGLGDVVLPDAPTPTTAIFVNGARPHPHGTGVQVLTRAAYTKTLHTQGNESAWGVWLIVGLSALFTALALINTAAMATSERRAELATIRLLGGTAGHAVRTIALETLPTILVALMAGAAVVAVSVHGIPDGLTGIPLTVPTTLIAGITAGAAALGLLAALVTTRLALRTRPAEAMREAT